MTITLDNPRFGSALVALVSFGALAAAYMAQYWGGLEPCVLCLYQRYVYMAALAVGVAGLAVAGSPAVGRWTLIAAGLVFFSGAAIAAFHVGVEQRWWRGTAGCHAPALDMNASVEQLREQLLETRFVPCDEIPWSLFGISMAGYNVLTSLALAAASLWAAGLLRRKGQA